MRLSLAVANRAAIVLLSGALGGCSNTTPGPEALPLSPYGASQSFARHHRESTAQSGSPTLRTLAPRMFPLMRSTRRAVR